MAIFSIGAAPTSWVEAWMEKMKNMSERDRLIYRLIDYLTHFIIHQSFYFILSIVLNEL